jgi:hypothetical protein
LKEEAVFHFHSLLNEIKEKPKVGAKFKYAGYETGGYENAAHKVWEYQGTVVPFATRGFGFYTHFVIVKDELKGKQAGSWYNSGTEGVSCRCTTGRE